MTQTPKVLILLGSANDEPYLEGMISVLNRFEIPFTVKVASAHRSPERVIKTLETYHDEVSLIITVAGHAAHLGGVVAAHTTHPVVAVPLATSSLSGFDALLASVQMPSGVPVAVMSLGEAGAKNAACFTAEIFSISNPELKQKLIEYKAELAEKVATSSKKVEEKWN